MTSAAISLARTTRAGSGRARSSIEPASTSARRDRGLLTFRKKLFEQAKIVAAGGDPQGVIRDPAENRKITLPGARKGYGVRGEGLPGLTGEEDVMFRAFLPFEVPQEIKDEVEAAMSSLVKGLRPDWWKRRRPVAELAPRAFERGWVDR